MPDFASGSWPIPIRIRDTPRVFRKKVATASLFVVTTIVRKRGLLLPPNKLVRITVLTNFTIEY